MTSPLANGNPWASAGQAEFAGSLIAKLPPGDAFTGATNLQGLLTGIASAFADVHAAAYQLSEVEELPWLTTLLLPHWNLDWGLPDVCTPAGATVQQQRAALMAKIAAAPGGQSKSYMIAVAAALGYSIYIIEDAASTYTWVVHAAPTAPTQHFHAGSNRAGDLLQVVGSNTQLECILRRIAPATKILQFSYP